MNCKKYPGTMDVRMNPVSPHIESLSRQLTSELAEVETRFTAELVSDVDCVNELVRHLERYRGKMLRPMLVFLAAQAAKPDQPIREEHRVIATTVELIHMASLVHDDILDEAELRRRGKTVNALRGNETAVMLGDYLFSHAYHLCSSLDSQPTARIIARAANTVCEGELLQLANRDNWSLDEETYMQIIHRKTAALVGVSCDLGARFADADPQMREDLKCYGELIGMAFQIADDVLDLTGDVATVGKSLGKDLEKGKLTLPLIRRMETAHRVEHQQLLDLLRADRLGNAERIAELVADSDAMDYTRRRAQRLVDQAKALVEALPDSPAKKAMDEVADRVIDRKF